MLAKIYEAERTDTELKIVFTDQDRDCLGSDDMWVRVEPGHVERHGDPPKYPLGVGMWG
jgi:hypothetical protein